MRALAGDGGGRRPGGPDDPGGARPRQRRLRERVLHEGAREAHRRSHLDLGRVAADAQQLHARATLDVLHLAAVHDDDHERHVVSKRGRRERPGRAPRSDHLQLRRDDRVRLQQPRRHPHQPHHRAVLPAESARRLGAADEGRQGAEDANGISRERRG